MAKNSVVSSHKINEAASGNPYLNEILSSLANTTNLQQSVTNTTKKNLPPQCKGVVSIEGGNYIVQIQNPGTVLPTSALQAAQSGRTVANTVSITPIYHQIRCAHTPSFSISGEVQTFGGTTGSTQVYWSLSLPAGQWYFQIRSSYDGINFNQWKNANGGQALNGKPETVTLSGQTNSVWGVFTLPGAELVAIGAGLVPNLGTFTLPDNLYSSAMFAIAGPNGFNEAGHPMHGVFRDEVDILTPASTAGLIGPADYPISVPMTYQDGEGNSWPGTSNIFAFAFDPLGANVTRFQAYTGNWALFQMPGGWTLAVGSGTVASGTTVQFPPGMNAAHMIGIASPNSFNDTGHPAHGVAQCSFDTSGLVTCQYSDGSGNVWSGNAQWFAFAFTPGVPTQAVGGGQFLVFTLPSGRGAAVGSGVVSSGTAFGLPTVVVSGTPPVVPIYYPSAYSDTGAIASTGESNLYALSSNPATVNANNTGNGSCTWSGWPAETTGSLTLTITVNSVVFTGTPASSSAAISYSLSDGVVHSIYAVSINAGLQTVSAVLPAGLNLNTLKVTAAVTCGIESGTPSTGTLTIGSMDVSSSIPERSGGAGIGPGGTGFTATNSLSIATPASVVDTGHPAHGVAQCSVSGNYVTLTYQDGEDNSWNGNANWLCFCWI